jgi:DNA-binding transcriptional ArsR family regulator
VSEDCDTTEILELLEDECARTILIETSAEPMSATTLSERCDVSPSTVYRRLDSLQACGLVEERLRPRPDGNHHSVYAARLERFALEFEDGELRTETSMREEPVDPEAETDPADRFTRMWEDL